jgi:O-antigen ligase
MTPYVITSLLSIFLLYFLSKVSPIDLAWNAFKQRRVVILFFLPLWLLIGWPMPGRESYNIGTDLGWIRVTRIVLFLLVGGYLVYFYLRQRRVLIPVKLGFTPYFLFVLICILSSSYSLDSFQTLWKSYELLILLGIWLSIYNMERRRGADASALLYSVFFLIFATCVFSLVGLCLYPDKAMVQLGGGDIATLEGVFPKINPNTLGQFGSIVALMGISFLFDRKQLVYPGAFILLLIGLAVVVLAHSRASIAGLFIVTPFLVSIHHLKRYYLLVTPLIIGLSLFTLNEIYEYVLRGQSINQFLTMTGRTQRWNIAWEHFLERPFFGYGYFVGHKSLEVWRGQGTISTVDNTYLESLVGVGLIGTFFLVVFACYSMATASKLYFFAKTKYQYRQVSSLAFIFIFITLLRSITSSSIQTLHFNLILIFSGLVCYGLLISKRIDNANYG